MSSPAPSESAPRRALFLDRDGVINEDTSYPHRPEDIVFREGIFDLCRLARERGYVLVVVTNQAGVARGKFTEDDVRKLHSWMGEQFAARGVPIEAFYYCPYHADAVVDEYRRDSDERKPGPGMFVRAAGELGLELESSLMVGDKPSDRIRLPGLRSVIIRSSYTGGDFDIESLGDVRSLL